MDCVPRGMFIIMLFKFYDISLIVQGNQKIRKSFTYFVKDIVKSLILKIFSINEFKKQSFW